MADIKDWNALGPISPEWEQGVKDYLGGKNPDLGLFPDIPSMRKFVTESKQAMTAQMGPKIEGVSEKDHEVSMRDGFKITCRVYTPTSPPSGGSPLVVIYHGGGWCIGGLENEEMLCRLLTSKLGATCVNVDYRLGPEYKFPTASNDCVDATKWAAASASSLGADPSKGFIIGGTSAGGNMTAVVSHTCKDENLKPAITGCLYLIPAVCFTAHIPEKYKPDAKSWEQNKDAPILSRKACYLFIDNYIPEEERADPRYSPLLWKSGHSGQPPSHFQICGADPLRDEALIYERMLREEEGIKTKVDVYPGFPHGFWSILPQIETSKKFVQDYVAGVKWLLEQK